MIICTYYQPGGRREARVGWAESMRYLRGPALARFVSKRESGGEGVWGFKAVAKASMLDIEWTRGGGVGELGYAL